MGSIKTSQEPRAVALHSLHSVRVDPKQAGDKYLLKDSSNVFFIEKTDTDTEVVFGFVLLFK